MQYALTLLALAASAAAAPSGCQTTYSGSFEIAPVNITSSAKRDLLPRQAACDTNPIITLNNGVLIDQNGRQGEIVANDQFQFDSPLQSDALFTDGFSVCANNSLASQDSAVFYGCKSGDFSNLYDKSLGKQCYPIYIEIIPCSGGNAKSSAISSPASSAATSAATSAPATTSSSSFSYVTPTSSITPYLPAMPTGGAPAVPVPSAPAPYPVGNSTTPAASGAPSATGAGATTSSPLTAPASGAETLAISAKFGAAAAAIVAFAML